MAKLTRLLLGGVVGAGLAYLFSRKDVRRRLMGGGQPQLPAVAGQHFGAPESPPTENITASPTENITASPSENITAPPTAAPVPPAFTPPAAAPVDLESRIDETRRQVEEQLEESLAPGAEAEAVETAPGTVDIKEEIDIAEAPEVLLEEEVIEERVTGAEEPATTVTEAQVEAGPTGESGSADYVPEDIEEIVAGEPVIAEEPAEEAVESDEFAALKTPAAGEPTIEAEATPADAVEAAPAGPIPSQIDREEMRRRIDETRARLKAKAFDAMVSGETFIEPEAGSAGLTQKHEAGGKIDEDLEERIDKSFKEQD